MATHESPAVIASEAKQSPATPHTTNDEIAASLHSSQRHYEKGAQEISLLTGNMGVAHGRMAIRPYISPAVGARLASPLD